MKSIFRPLVASFSILALLAAPAGLQAATMGSESPEALIERLTDALEREDFAELIRCIEPEGREAMAAMLTMIPLMMIAFASMAEMMAEDMQAAAGEEPGEPAGVSPEFAQLRDGFAGVLAKHGLSDLLAEEEEMDFEAMDAVFADIDHAAYIEDVARFLSEVDPDEDGSPREMLPLPMDEEVRITDLRVDGDTATAQWADEEIEMVRIDGRWYLKLDLDLSE